MNTHNTSQQYSNMRGSVLFIILIAVALFGALSYTVASMMNSGDATYVSEEKAELYADEILNYARKVRQTVQFLKISNDCDDTDISFENDAAVNYVNPNAPSDKSCHVFDTAGGGLSYIEQHKQVLDSNFSATGLYKQVYFNGGTSITGVGTSALDLIVAVPYLKEEVCLAINKKIGLGDFIPVDDATGIPFRGVFTAASTPEIGDEDTRIEGRNMFCLQAGGGSPYYSYVGVLIPR